VNFGSSVEFRRWDATNEYGVEVSSAHLSKTAEGGAAQVRAAAKVGQPPFCFSTALSTGL
jgi:hypothetical protein